jgi:hypothetical protein
MKLRERYNYLNDLLEKAEVEYTANPQFSTELEIVSLKEECRQLLSKIDKEEQKQPGDSKTDVSITDFLQQCRLLNSGLPGAVEMLQPAERKG